MDDCLTKYIEFGTIGSTNDYSKEMDGSVYEDGSGPCSVVVSALEQTAGRGRYGRSFHSPRGTGIYMTYSFRPAFSQTDSIRSTLVTAAVVHRVLSRYSGDSLSIKWVNDIYRNGRKITGILVEGVPGVHGGDTFDRLVIGIGINLFPSPVPEELTDIVGFLTDGPSDGTSAEAMRQRIIREVARGLNEAFLSGEYDPSPYIDYYKQYCFNLPDELPF